MTGETLAVAHLISGTYGTDDTLVFASTLTSNTITLSRHINPDLNQLSITSDILIDGSSIDGGF